jgi:hypothetical protein
MFVTPSHRVWNFMERKECIYHSLDWEQCYYCTHNLLDYQERIET